MDTNSYLAGLRREDGKVYHPAGGEQGGARDPLGRQPNLFPEADRGVDGHRRAGGGFRKPLPSRRVHLTFLHAQRVQRVGSDERRG